MEVKDKDYLKQLIAQGKRVCKACNVIKSLDDFANDSSNKTCGKRATCKKCTNKITNQKKISKETERYEKYLNSDWYKKRMQSGAKPNAKKAHDNFLAKFKEEKRKKFRGLPQYQ